MFRQHGTGMDSLPWTKMASAGYSEAYESARNG